MKRKLYSQVIKDKENIDKNRDVESEIRNEFEIDSSKGVVVINDNTINKSIKLIAYKIEGVFRAIGWIILMLFLSVGATVIVNDELREVFINIFK